MNWKSFMIGAAIGAISGYLVRELAAKNSTLSPEKVLDNIKKQVGQDGVITGSWIHMNEEPFEKQKVYFKVYKGGISKLIDDVSEQYEFIADAKTGTLIDFQQLT
ncbi:PepSY domain-containing protein [Bacillus rubiinfantis]|uniref:PepSY domain-containing protein n=1 Tax=Bacillus rubiinfantis TaxID=1499680 RepID=UPI0005A8941E|nr:PepSY domain-containing protein [Bacillus rubiinfantis]